MTANPQIDFPWIKENSLEIETPFENDFWNRKALADRLTDYVSRLKVGATIAIDAEWGAGKSWFVKNWQRQLELQEFKVIYLNAFNQDYIDDPFLTISMEIANILSDNSNTLDNIKQTIGETYRAILPNLPMIIFQVAMSLIGAGKVAHEVVEAFKNIQDDTGKLGEFAAELLNEKLVEHLSAQVDNYENEKNSLIHFKNELSKITSSLDKPLIFIIDELDRCKPEFAIRLIERIKHFFDIPNVVFILAVNKKQLEESINNFYGFTTADNYLEKFIDFTIILKNQDMNGDRYRKILLKYSDEQQLNIESLLDHYIHLCKIYEPNPRKLIRIINKFSLLKSDLNNEKTLFLFLILIYNELGLIDSFDDINFSNHFHDLNSKKYKNGFLSYIEDRNRFTNNTNNITINNYLASYVYNFRGKSLLDNYFTYIDFLKDNRSGNKYSKNIYYPKNNSPDTEYDLVEAWYKYIHMVDD